MQERVNECTFPIVNESTEEIDDTGKIEVQFKFQVIDINIPVSLKFYFT